MYVLVFVCVWMYVCLWLDWSWGWAYALYKWWCCSFLVHWRVVWVLRCCCCCCCYSQLFVVVVAWLLYVGRFCCWNAADKWVLAFLLKRRGKMCVDLHTNKHSHSHTHIRTHTQCVTHTHTGIRSELQTNSKYTQKTLESTRTSGHLETVWSDLGRWCRANQFETRNSIRWFIKSIKSSF